MDEIRQDWTFEELSVIYHLPLLELISQANAIHSKYQDRQEVQICTLISIKTGGCPEDCKYCSQSSRYQTNVVAQPLMDLQKVLEEAKKAIARGATRVCLGAAWREVRDSIQFDQVLQMIKSITDLGVEVCCTLGMLKEHQAKRLKDAGLYAYNHNLDSSEKFYKTIITTRTYQDRLNTLDVVQKSGISVCCGGILGIGESHEDRLQMLHVLCNRTPHPESVPINRLGPVAGTPLENQALASIWDIVRMIATTRIVIPQAMVRLSAGRVDMSFEQQALCFLAGANSIFVGEKLLTIPNPALDKDEEMFRLFGLKKRPAFAK
jgi:biotin synthase